MEEITKQVKDTIMSEMRQEAWEIKDELRRDLKGDKNEMSSFSSIKNIPEESIRNKIFNSEKIPVSARKMFPDEEDLEQIMVNNFRNIDINKRNKKRNTIYDEIINSEDRKRDYENKYSYKLLITNILFGKIQHQMDF